MLEASFKCDVGEGPVAIVLEQVVEGLLAGGEAFETGAIDEEDVEPAIIVVVIKGNAAPCRLEQVFVLVFAAEDGDGVETGLFGNVDEGDAKIGLWRRCGCLLAEDGQRAR